MTKKATSKPANKAALQPTLIATPKKGSKAAANDKAKQAPAKPAKDAPAKDSTRLQIFKLLAKHPDGLALSIICERLGLKRRPALVKHECLADKPRMKRGKPEGTGALVYSLTAAGKAAIKAGTVDSEAPESSAGYTDKE